MLQEINEKLDKYLEAVKTLDTDGKRKELYDSLFHFASVIKEMAQNDGVELHYLNNREINDLYKKDLSEDDYLEAMLVYFEIVKNMVGEYLLYKQQ